ncbi:unnamed protein product [Fraxinus pennsylvanica]|uniref:Uncharacterized protein n=1 Tax=Fraxinus pennsylvanica TaxID=56036 RepID=A0AAD2A8Y3_9LAMI|nr:unnamed protein product [Fraxinus pennsylvanica]
MSEVLEELENEVIVPIYHPHEPRSLGVEPMSGILLHGPPGCGKTKLSNAIANEAGFPFYKICATELASGVSVVVARPVKPIRAAREALEAQFEHEKAHLSYQARPERMTPDVIICEINPIRKRPRPSASEGFDRLLRRRIELSGKKRASVDQLVEYLGSTYREYERHKLQPFTKGVQQILEHMDDCNNEKYNEERIPSRRNSPKKVEEDEEKTRLIEKHHNKMRAGRINDDFENDIGSSSSMASAASTSTSESESNNSSEEDT